jgi:hypothetical protein
VRDILLALIVTYCLLAGVFILTLTAVNVVGPYRVRLTITKR